MYNRFGEESPMLEAMSSEEILGTALDDLLEAPGELLNYKHTLAYTDPCRRRIGRNASSQLRSQC